MYFRRAATKNPSAPRRRPASSAGRGPRTCAKAAVLCAPRPIYLFFPTPTKTVGPPPALLQRLCSRHLEYRKSIFILDHTSVGADRDGLTTSPHQRTRPREPKRAPAFFPPLNTVPRAMLKTDYETGLRRKGLGRFTQKKSPVLFPKKRTAQFRDRRRQPPPTGCAGKNVFQKPNTRNRAAASNELGVALREEKITH